MVKTLFFKPGAVISTSKWILVAIHSFILLTGCAPEKRGEAKIIFTGDILLSRNVRLEIEQTNTNPWRNIDSRLKSADLVIGNLEGAVGVPGLPVDSNSKAIIFDIPKTCLNLLREAGFTVLTLENNHSSDLGTKNKDSTIIEVNNLGIQSVHYNNSPRFFKINNNVISIVAVNTVPDLEGHNEIVPSVILKQKLRLAKSLSTFVIVTIHWGSELLEWPNQFQRTTADWLVDNGADLIIGHHPHVIQKPEIIKGKPVFFSLGNHLFDQKYPVTKEGLMVECIIKNGKTKFIGITTHSVKNSYFPEIIAESHFKFPEESIREPAKFSGIELIPISIDNKTDGEIILEGYQNDKKLWQTNPMPLVSISTANFDSKYNYLMTLEKHYSSIDGEYGLRPYVYNITNAGLVDLWRGSALSRPLIDATLTPDKKYLVALHRGDSFLNLNSLNAEMRFEAYQWNGFGFSGYIDYEAIEFAKKYYSLEQNVKR
jgi:poly-gamma-glutamate synthesis protein (capsule biosynthesis protein)